VKEMNSDDKATQNDFAALSKLNDAELDKISGGCSCNPVYQYFAPCDWPMLDDWPINLGLNPKNMKNNVSNTTGIGHS
jgi:hypothetical protein